MSKENPIPMPRYKCHKEVDALKIKEIRYIGQGMFSMSFEESDVELRLSSAWIDRYEPSPGGYYVRYRDGYTSYSPAQEFEDGYTRLP